MLDPNTTTYCWKFLFIYHSILNNNLMIFHHLQTLLIVKNQKQKSLTHFDMAIQIRNAVNSFSKNNISILQRLGLFVYIAKTSSGETRQTYSRPAYSQHALTFWWLLVFRCYLQSLGYKMWNLNFFFSKHLRLSQEHLD